MKALVNFVIVCVFLPGLYVVAAYWYYGHLDHQKVSPLTFALFASSPLLVSGIRDWWDVWIVPYPKMGGTFSKIEPKDYYISLLKIHGLAFAACLAVHLWSNHQIAEKRFERSTLDVPRTKARIARFELKIKEANGEWREGEWLPWNLPYKKELDEFPEVEKEGLPLGTHERQVDDYIEERDRLKKKLENHEKQVKFLASNPAETPDKFSYTVVLCFMYSAALGAVLEPKRRRFDSGDPIERA